MKKRINYFGKGGIAFASPRRYQTGGATASAGTSDEQLYQQVYDLMQRVSQGDEQALAALEQIRTAAEKGDEQAIKIVQIMQQLLQQQEATARSAAIGGKIDYVSRLRNGVGMDETVLYHRRGGRMYRQVVRKPQNGQTIK